MNRSKQNSVFFNSTRLEEHSLFSSKSVKITSTKTLLSPLFPLSHKGLMHEQFKIVYLKAFIQSTDVKLRKNGHISQCTNWREMETILAMTSRAFKYLLLIKIQASHLVKNTPCTSFFLLQRTQMRHFISLHSNLAMLEHETVARLQNEVARLKAEKAQLEDKCFSQEVEIELNQTTVNQVGETVNINRQLQIQQTYFFTVQKVTDHQLLY